MTELTSITGMTPPSPSAPEDRAMRRTPGHHAATAAALVLCLAAVGCTPKPTPPADEPTAAAPAAEPAKPEVTKAVVEPDAVNALQRMSAFLQTLDTFDFATDTSLDLVNEHGQRVTLDGTAHYKFRRPNGFMIDLRSDYKNRRFYFDGKQITVYAPDFGYYATAPAPATVRGALDLMSAKYGITLPLEDLFRWSDPASNHAESLTSAFLVGSATVDGVETDHYAYREGDKDWQVWIERGAKPFPRRLVIIDRTDPANPTYDARLTWKADAAPGPDQFVFKPGHDDKHIRFASIAD
jgi:hypothetical protein